MKNILIVDDNENDRILCEKEFSDEGYITHTVSSGLEALEFLDNNPHLDLIILDIRMPLLDGIEVLKRIRSENYDIRIILYSDYSNYKDNLVAWLANGYVIKSSNMKELKNKVRELLSFEG